MSIEPKASRLWLINFYREQLSKFRKIGLGQKTEFGVKVTEKLVNCTRNRLTELAVVYEHTVSDQAKYQRRLKAKVKGQLNGISDTTGTITELGKQSDSNT